MSTTDTPETLAAVVEAATGRPLDQLTTTEALDAADRLRAVVDALDAPTPGDARLAADMASVAELVETAAGIA